MPEAPKYSVVRKLEAGGMAEVFQAEVESIEGFKKQVAIKRVLPHLSQNRQFIEMFLDEARLSLKFSHANVVQTFSIGTSDNTYFIVMEFIDGVNVRKIMEYYETSGQLMEAAHAAFVINEVCKGLSYAHAMKGHDGKSLGVVHRDVSPPNVLLSKEGEVKIVDFGLAKATSQLESTDPGLIKGKFAYLAPEAAHGLEVDNRADIFAAGTVLWELLTGRRLFKGETDYDTVMNVRDASIPPVTSINPNIPPEMDGILGRALERDPSRRYQDAAEFGGELMKMLFSRQMLVTSYDIAKLVKSVQQAEPSEEVSREVDIIDRLIEDELARITSVEDGENPFSDGAKPILTSELSGMLGGPETAGSLEDPRQWGADLLTETGEFQLPDVEDGAWRESQVYELGDPASNAPQEPVDLENVASRPPGSRSTTAPALDTGEMPEQKKSRAGLWVAITALAAIGAAAAVYYFVFLNG
jgi:serine/threonine-protein kinase